jgi:hypothetical protein
MVLSLGALALTGFGLRAMVRMRTWGVLALGAAGAMLVALSAADFAAAHLGALRPLLGGSLLMLAAVPFARPMLRWVRV